jgi:hypothetical protein
MLLTVHSRAKESGAQQDPGMARRLRAFGHQEGGVQQRDVAYSETSVE